MTYNTPLLPSFVVAFELFFAFFTWQQYHYSGISVHDLWRHWPTGILAYSVLADPPDKHSVTSLFTSPGSLGSNNAAPYLWATIGW
jgi:hypothetical protein